MSTTTTELQTHGHGDHGGHGGHEEHNPYHQHHFTTMEQQFDTSKLGMWTFIATEVLMFGGLFVGFGISQGKYPHEFVDAHHHLQRWAGALNTIVLLVSSWTMVMAVNAAQTNKQKQLRTYLLFTILCACIFMGVKYYEYSHKFEEGLLPGKYYVAQAADSIQACQEGKGIVANCTYGYATFFSFYFMMTGLHGFHILVGIALLSWLYVKAGQGMFSPSYYTPVDLIGLYWHIVDMIWIYLFPLYYLIT